MLRVAIVVGAAIGLLVVFVAGGLWSAHRAIGALKPALATIAIACTDSVPADLRQGAAFIRSLTSPRQLRQSTFMGLEHSGRPSELVSFLLSPLGAAEWPGPGPDEEMPGLGFVPRVPAGLHFSHLSPDTQFARQIVLRGDDARNMIIVEGYLDPMLPPALRVEYDLHLPSLEPHELEYLQLLARDNEGLGIRPTAH